jgi:hypothetical protein
MYLSYLSSSSEGSSSRIEESETSSRSNRKGDQLEVRRSEENSIDAWNFFLLKGGHVLMMMRA